MRGTVLKLKRHIFERDHSKDDAEEECHNGDFMQNNRTSSSIPTPSVSAENSSQDLNKNVLMSNLDLRRTSVASEADTHFSNNSSASPFQRTVFDWNDESMWKAMSRHPLFSKYMELQSQLNRLFEEIRLDCKKAACEKAFSSLLKDDEESPFQSTPVAALPKPTTTTTAEVLPKRKPGRPLKKKLGRPRKEDSTPTSTEWTNVYATTPNKHLRKCKEELFLSRKPSWICQNCAKCFSSSGWLDRHKSVCSFSKLALESPLGDKIDNSFENSNVGDSSEVANGSLTSKTVTERTYSVSKLSDTSVSLSPGRPIRFKLKEEMPNNIPLPMYQPHASSVSPLKPKMENHNGNEEDEVLRKPLCNEECANGESTVVNCGKCRQQFNAQIHLKTHLEEYPECDLYASPHCSDSGGYSSDSSVTACKHCGKTFTNEKFLKRHQSMCHMKTKKKLWQCSNCFKSFRRQKRHEQHQRDCISKGKLLVKQTQRCENCSMLFATHKKLLKHQAICCPDSTNDMVKLLKCLKCALVFPTYKKQLKHRAVCCPDRDTEAMVCHYCSKVLIMKDRMAAHRKKCQKMSIPAST